MLVGLFAGGFEFFFEVLPGAVVGLCGQLFGCALEGDVAAFASDGRRAVRDRGHAARRTGCGSALCGAVSG